MWSIPESDIIKINLARHAPSGFNCLFSSCGYAGDLDFDFVLEVLVPCAKQLDTLAVDLAATNVRVEERFHGDNAIACDTTTLDECRQLVEIQRSQKYGIGIGEPAFRNATIQRGLSTLKTRSGSTMTGGLTFVTFARSLALT